MMKFAVLYQLACFTKPTWNNERLVRANSMNISHFSCVSSEMSFRIKESLNFVEFRWELIFRCFISFWITNSQLELSFVSFEMNRLQWQKQKFSLEVLVKAKLWLKFQTDFSNAQTKRRLYFINNYSLLFIYNFTLAIHCQSFTSWFEITNYKLLFYALADVLWLIESQYRQEIEV